MSCEHSRSAVKYDFHHVDIYQCPECGLAFRRDGLPCRKPEDIYHNFYKSENSFRFGYGVEFVVRAFRFFRAFKVFTVNPRSGRILDIGSGRGLMLFYLRKFFGYNRAAGTQIEKNALEFSRNKLGLEIYGQDFLELDFGNDKFDIISLWHVLEHLPEPGNYIKKIRLLLDNNGNLIIEVPNFNSWTARLTGRFWLGLDLRYHLYFFTPESLSRILTVNGFSIKKIHTFSLEYSTFISVQSLASWLTRSDSIFFRFLQGEKFPFTTVLWHWLLFLVLALPAFLINVLLYFSRQGEVLFMVAVKDSELRDV